MNTDTETLITCKFCGHLVPGYMIGVRYDDESGHEVECCTLCGGNKEDDDR